MGKQKASFIAEAAGEVGKLIDRSTGPDKMSKADALDVLEAVGEDIAIRTAALREELARG